MTKLREKPIIHGRDHLPGGPDPIPGLLTGPSGTVGAAIIATVPGAYYKLNETGSDDWADSSGSGLDATYTSRTGEVRGVASSLDEDDGSLCVTVDGPTAGAAVSTSDIGHCDDTFFCFPGTAEFSVTARVRPSELPPTLYSFGICGNIKEASPNNNSVGWGLYLAGTIMGTGGAAAAMRKNGGSEQIACAAAAATVDEWIRLTATYDGTTLTLYGDDVELATDTSPNPSFPAAGATTSRFQIGSVGAGEGIGGTQAPWNGEIDSVAVWDRCLSPSEVGGIAAFETAPGGALDGYVLTADGTGDTAWRAPSVEVEY